MSSTSPTNRDPVLERLADRHIGAIAVVPGRTPLAYLVAGQPGSGKSRLAQAAMSRCVADGGAPVHVDPDKLRGDVPGYEALAAQNPDAAFKHSHPVVSAWADWLRDEAICLGRDLVLEGLFKTPENTLRLVSQLADAGYQTKLSVKVVPRELSLLQVERRYERQVAGRNGSERVPRRLPAAAHDVGYAAIPPLVELAERFGLDVTLYDLANNPVGTSGPKSAELLRRRAAGLDKHEQVTATSLLLQVQGYRERRGAPPAEPGSALRAVLEMVAIRT